MAIASLTTSTTSISLVRLSATIRPTDDDDRRTAATGADPATAESATAAGDDLDAAAALLDKLDAALEALREGRRGHGHGRRLGYDRRGALDDGPARPRPASATGAPSAAGASLTAATVDRTEISVGPDGVGYSKASLSVGHLATATGTVDVLSLSVTRAYLGFGPAAPAGRGAEAAVTA